MGFSNPVPLPFNGSFMRPRRITFAKQEPLVARAAGGILAGQKRARPKDLSRRLARYNKHEANKRRPSGIRNCSRCSQHPDYTASRTLDNRATWKSIFNTTLRGWHLFPAINHDSDGPASPTLH